MAIEDTEQQQIQQAEAASRVRQQVEDALELARFVVATGFRDAAGQPLPFADIETVQNTAATLGIIKIDGDTAAANTLTKQEWAAFEQAYYRLAIATSPVTAETLRNTRYAAGAGGTHADERLNLRRAWKDAAPAQKFTWQLWFWATGFAVFVLLTEAVINWLGMAKDAASVSVWMDLTLAVQPWAYGGLGACAYLLRSGHYFIYARSFDLRRTPEYFNRILLGALSGGAIILFVDYLVSAEDSVSHLGSTAFGFIAGYSSDFLFNTIERIVNAIFPKVASETGPRDDKTKKPAKPAPKGDGDGAAAAGAGAGAGAG